MCDSNKAKQHQASCSMICREIVVSRLDRLNKPICRFGHGRRVGNRKSRSKSERKVDRRRRSRCSRRVDETAARDLTFSTARRPTEGVASFCFLCARRFNETQSKARARRPPSHLEIEKLVEPRARLDAAGERQRRAAAASYVARRRLPILDNTPRRST